MIVGGFIFTALYYYLCLNILWQSNNSITKNVCQVLILISVLEVCLMAKLDKFYIINKYTCKTDMFLTVAIYYHLYNIKDNNNLKKITDSNPIISIDIKRNLLLFLNTINAFTQIIHINYLYNKNFSNKLPIIVNTI